MTQKLEQLQVASRGFSFFEFLDVQGEKCSLQESSLHIPCVWFGRDKAGGTARMHLTQEHVRQLIPQMRSFCSKGSAEVVTLVDQYGESCRLEVDGVELKIGPELEEGRMAMRLKRDHVEKLLPMLILFKKTGWIARKGEH